MSTEKQIDANRRNALLSTLCADLESDWQPLNRTEQLLVEQMAVSQWKLTRLEFGERSIFEKEMPAERKMALLDRFSPVRLALNVTFKKLSGAPW